MTVVSMSTFSWSGGSKRRPAAWPDARSRGRRQPNFRTRRYQVDGEAHILPSRCARTASVPMGTCRYSSGHHVLIVRISPGVRLDGGATCADTTADRQGTRMLPPPPGLEPTRGQPQESQECPQPHKRPGVIHASQNPGLVACVGQGWCIDVNFKLRSRARARRSSAVSFFTRRRSTSFGAVRSYPRAVEKGRRDSWRYSYPRWLGRDPEAGDRSAAEAGPWSSCG